MINHISGKSLEHNMNWNLNSELNALAEEKLKLAWESDHLEQEFSNKFYEAKQLKEKLYNKSIQVQDIENEAGGCECKIFEYKEMTLHKLERANAKLLDAFESIEIEISQVEKKLNNTLNNIRWYNITRKIDAHALRNQLRHLEETREQIIEMSDVLVEHIEFLDIHLDRTMAEISSSNV